MKTAISIPDPVFRNAEQLAKHLKVSRSRLYAVAVAEYVKRHRATKVTDKLNAIYGDSDSALDETIATIQTRSLPRERW
jgi:metal-responsive CopG/Arc/MetJ family transcriptional regulator